MIFSLFVGKNTIFSNTDNGGWGMRDIARVSTTFGRDCGSCFVGELAETCFVEGDMLS